MGYSCPEGGSCPSADLPQRRQGKVATNWRGEGGIKQTRSSCELPGVRHIRTCSSVTVPGWEANPATPESENAATASNGARRRNRSRCSSSSCTCRWTGPSARCSFLGPRVPPAPVLMLQTNEYTVLVLPSSKGERERSRVKGEGECAAVRFWLTCQEPHHFPLATNRARASLVAELRESILSSRSISESIYLPICLPPPTSLFLSFLVHPLRYF